MSDMSQRYEPCCAKGFITIIRGHEHVMFELTAGDIGYPQTFFYTDDDLQFAPEPEDEDFSIASVSLCLGCLKPAKGLMDFARTATFKSILEEES